MGQITINGKSYSGLYIKVTNNEVIIDGEDIPLPKQDKVINISVQGNVHALTVSSSKIDIIGNVDACKTGSGDITIKGNVESIETGSGDVKCNNVRGNIKTGSGDIYCQTNSGNIHM